jgi:hypothetical protein
VKRFGQLITGLVDLYRQGHIPSDRMVRSPRWPDLAARMKLPALAT